MLAKGRWIFLQGLSIHLTHPLGKKRNLKQAATGADKRGRRGGVPECPIIPGWHHRRQPCRKGAARVRKRSQPPRAASVPFMCSGKQRGGRTRSLPVNFARVDDHHVRRSGEGPGPRWQTSRGWGAGRRLNPGGHAPSPRRAPKWRWAQGAGRAPGHTIAGHPRGCDPARPGSPSLAGDGEGAAGHPPAPGGGRSPARPASPAPPPLTMKSLAKLSSPLWSVSFMAWTRLMNFLRISSWLILPRRPLCGAGAPAARPLSARSPLRRTTRHPAAFLPFPASPLSRPGLPAACWLRSGSAPAPLTAARPPASSSLPPPDPPWSSRHGHDTAPPPPTSRTRSARPAPPSPPAPPHPGSAPRPLAFPTAALPYWRAYTPITGRPGSETALAVLRVSPAPPAPPPFPVDGTARRGPHGALEGTTWRAGGRLSGARFPLAGVQWAAVDARGAAPGGSGMSGHVVATAPRPGAGGSRSIAQKLPDQKDPAPGGKRRGSLRRRCRGAAAVERAAGRWRGGTGQGTGAGADTWPGSAPRVFVCMYIKYIYVCVFV